MILAPGLAIPVVLATSFSGAFMVNEWSHGALAEGIGLGHRHMLDYAGWHCAAHDGELGQAHAAHMHGAQPVAHGECPGDGAMHGQGTMPMAPGADGGMTHG